MASFDAVDHTKFDLERTIASIKKVSADTTSFEFVVTAHLRMSGVYWGLTAMALLGKDLKTEMNSDDIVEWVMTCFDESVGGFCGNVDHDPHMLYTLSALQILALCGALDRVDRDKVEQFIVGLQHEDGSVMGDKWGEIDTRFSYCAIQALAIIDRLPASMVSKPINAEGETKRFDVPLAVSFVAACKNFDGGFGAVPGAESHAGQIFCCVAFLSIAQAMHVVDRDLLCWWLAERQCDSGGLNGRPEKQSDVCYSWWILSSLSILGRTSWIDEQALAKFILDCQDPEDGGISDRPGNMGDIFHTFFGIAGLSLLGYFESRKREAAASANSSTNAGAGGDGGMLTFRDIDPTYALPSDLVESMGWPTQVLRTESADGTVLGVEKDDEKEEKGEKKEEKEEKKEEKGEGKEA